MPKVVDSQLRRRQITDAVCRVIERGGMAEATLANVAAEAGLAIGSVRHYVGSHPDLLRLTMSTVGADVGERLRASASALLAERSHRSLDERRAGLVDLLAEMLPMDPRRRTEAVVWIAFGEAARTDPQLRPLLEDMYDRVRSLLRLILHEVRPEETGAANVVDAHRLAVVLNGLALDAVQLPDRVTRSLMRRVLRRELDAILG